MLCAVHVPKASRKMVFGTGKARRGRGASLKFEEMKHLFEEGSPADWSMEAEGKWRHKENYQLAISAVGFRELGSWYPRVPYEWAKVVPSFHDPANAVIYAVLNGDDLLCSIDVALVDGGRGVIPYPHHPDYPTIETWLYKFARVVENPAWTGHDSYDLDKWLAKAGIAVI